MNDNDNIKELIGARLEEIHLSETMTDTMPSDEEILRWETLAQALRAQKQRNKRRLLSLAAVFLLAVVISVAVIVSPPDAEAGGNGKAVIVDNEKGMTVELYETISEMPAKVKKDFVVINERKNNCNVKYIQYTDSKNVRQLEMVYGRDTLQTFAITQIISDDNTILENDPNYLGVKERWEEKEILIIQDPKDKEKISYSFIYDNTYVYVYTENINKEEAQKIIEEAF